MYQLNPTLKMPLYEQVKNMIILYITQGVYTAHEILPSIRELASQLAINPNTVSKAYKDLEQEGYIYSIVGKGSFVNETSKLLTLQKETALEDFSNQVADCRQSNIEADELVSIIQEIYYD